MNGHVINFNDAKEIVKEMLTKEYKAASKFIERTEAEPIMDKEAQKRYKKTKEKQAEIAKKMRKLYEA